MYKPGHVGMALIFVAPISFILNIMEMPGIAALCVFSVMMLTTKPDWDLKMPFVKHRGITHTIYSATFVGVLTAVAFTQVNKISERIAFISQMNSTNLIILGFVIGFISIIAHLMADVITITGIQPFSFGKLGKYRPFSFISKDTRYQLQWTRADNPIANFLLIFFGFVLTIASFYPIIQNIPQFIS